MNIIKSGYLSSEFHTLAANLLVSYGALIKLVTDLSEQKGLLANHPTVGIFVGIALALNICFQSIAYTLGRSSIKAAAIADPANPQG